MIAVSPESKPMKVYRAGYKDSAQKECKYDLYASSLSRATLAAAELAGPDGTLLRVYENPEW